MKLMVWVPPPSGCSPLSTVITPLGASTPAFDGTHCYATIFLALSWENPCDTSFDIDVYAEVYYDIPGATLMWTGSVETHTITAGSGGPEALADSGPIAYDLATGGSGVIYRIIYYITYPDSSTTTLTTPDDYTGSCT